MTCRRPPVSRHDRRAGPCSPEGSAHCAQPAHRQLERVENLLDRAAHGRRVDVEVVPAERIPHLGELAPRRLRIPLEDLCRAGKEMGLTSIDLVDPPDFEIMKKYGLTTAMVSFPSLEVNGKKIGSIPHGFNRLENHETLIKLYEPLFKQTADFGAKQVICFSGNRDGMDPETGIKNCAEGLKKLMPLAEKHGITLVMELLNSRVNHADYMCDTSAWGIQLCEAVGSERFKLLFDIYHMQIMDGDVIARIRSGKD